MLDEDLAHIRAHRNNIDRYRRLNRTKFSDVQCQFVELRLSEEQAALEALTSRTFLVAFTMPKGSPAPGSLEAAP